MALHQNISSGLPDNLEELIISLSDSVYEPCELGVVYLSEINNLGDSENYIEIYNSGNLDCSLEGFRLDDTEELDDFIFSDIIIPGAGFWIGYEYPDSSFSFGFSPGYNVLFLADANGEFLSINLDEIQDLDGVQLSQSFDSDGVGCYTFPTPGFLNGECIMLDNDAMSLHPKMVNLHQNHPNPFNPYTIIEYNLREDTFVNLNVYDLNGVIVFNLLSNQQQAGHRSVKWSGTDNSGRKVSTGIYFYTVEIEDYSETKKMIFLK
ncbi:MAG: FlgD immunoglobulin-like domain containing protein [Candidatus Neomarinimicrobiota bacterium]